MGLLAGELASLLHCEKLCVLTFYMDDSADKHQEKVYVVAGFLGDSEVWFEAERHWDIRLKQEEINYFRSNECHTLTGEFKKLIDKYGRDRASEMRDALLRDLWLIVKSATLFGFVFLGPMPAYKTVQAEPYSEYVFERDPYAQAHQHLIYHVAARVCRQTHRPEPVAFIFDEHNKASYLEGRWPQIKANSPVASRCMGTLAALDDRRSPAVQMGDLIANTAKRVFEDHMHDPAPAVEKLKAACGQYLACVGAWDEGYLRSLREASIDSATTPSIAFEFTNAIDL